MKEYNIYCSNAGGAVCQVRLRGRDPTLGTCVGNPTGGKRSLIHYRFLRSGAGFFYGSDYVNEKKP